MSAAATIGSFAFGVSASVAAWRLVLVAYAPRIAVSSEVSVVENRRGEIAYRFKVLNRSRYSRLFDLEINCAVLLRSLDPDLPTNSRVVKLRVADGELQPTLGARTREWRRRPPRRVDEPAARIFRIRSDQLTDGALQHLTQPLRERYATMGLSVEDLLNVGEGSRVRVIVVASHGVSGRRTATVRHYGLDALQPRRFGRRDSVSLEP